MYEYEDREPREGDLVVWEDVSGNNPHIEQNKPYYVIEAKNTLVIIYNKNNNIVTLGSNKRKVIKQIKPEEAKPGDMIFRRNGSSKYFKKFSSKEILYIDKINNKYIFGYSSFDQIKEDEVIIYREQKQVQKENIYQDTDYIRTLLENGVKLHSEPTSSGSGIVTTEEDFLNPDITYALANRLDGEPLPSDSSYKSYWQQKFEQGENVYFYAANNGRELKCGIVPESEKGEVSPNEYEPKNMGYVFFFLKKETELPALNNEYFNFWNTVKESGEIVLIQSSSNKASFPNCKNGSGWMKSSRDLVKNMFFALESQQDIPLPGTQQYFDYCQEKHNSGVKVCQFYPGTKEWSTSYLKDNFSKKTCKEWNRESICLFREWNRERDLNPSQYTQDTTYADHPKDTSKGWYVYLNQNPNGYYLWKDGTVNKMACNPKSDKYPGYFEHEDEAWRAREKYLESLSNNKSKTPEYDDAIDALRFTINLNKNKEETMTNNIKIKEEIKEAIAEMICNKEEKAVKSKTDYQRRPKIIAIYYTGTGSEIESKSFKTEQEAKDHLVVLQSQGNPNAKVTIYKREKTHKIKTQFETIS